MFNKTHYLTLLGITALTCTIHCAQSMEEDTVQADSEISDVDVRTMSGLLQVREAELDHPLQAYSQKFSKPEEVFVSQLFPEQNSVPNDVKHLSIIVRTPHAFDSQNDIVQQFLTHYPQLLSLNSQNIKLENICFINPDGPEANAVWKQQEFFKYKYLHGINTLFSGSKEYLNVWPNLKFMQDKSGHLTNKASGFNSNERFVTLVQNRQLIYHLVTHKDAAKQVVETLKNRD